MLNIEVTHMSTNAKRAIVGLAGGMGLIFLLMGAKTATKVHHQYLEGALSL